MSQRLETFFHRYLHWVNRHRFLCGACCIALVAVSLYLSSGLALRSSLKELLPENSPSVVELDRMLARVGGTSVLTVTVASPDVAANTRFIDDLNARLETLPKDEVRYVIAKVDKIRQFYDNNMLHFIANDDLQKLYTRVKEVVDFEKFKRTPFFLDLEEPGPPMNLNVDDIKERNKKNVKMPLAVYENYYGGDEGRFLILMLRPQGSSIAIDRARALIARVKGIVAELGPARYSPEMSVGYCGNVVTTVEEYDTLKSDMFSTAGLCIALVCAAIALYFLRLRIVGFLGVTLAIGILLTFAVTRIFIGYLNAQTAFLASIIIGTGINYGIMLIGRYLEERKGGLEPTPAMERALANVSVPTFLAAGTTALAFAILMIARVRGLSQFGFIGSVGVMFCWLVTMLLLPLMVLISERVLNLTRKLLVPKRQSAVLPEMDRVLYHFPAILIACAAIIAVVAGTLVYRYIPDSLEYDFSKLRNKISAVSGTEALERRVAKLWVGSMTPAVVMLDRPEDGPVVCEALMRKNNALPPAERMVDSCVNVYDLLPKDQAAKADTLTRFRSLFSQGWVREVKGGLGQDLKRMQTSLDTRELTVADLPADLVHNFTDLAGNVGTFAYINPRSGIPLSDGRNLMRFGAIVQDIPLPDGRVMHATGESIIFSELVNIVKDEAPLLVLASFLAVSLLVLVVVRRINEGYVVVVSLAWIVLVQLAAMALFDIRINFFNFIALPLTIGIGVDYSINIAMRFNEERRARTVDILRHTGGAVVLCSLTTTIGYLVLMRSANQAVAQFGFVCVLGEIVSIFAAMLIVPAVILVSNRRRLKRGARTRMGEAMIS